MTGLSRSACLIGLAAALVLSTSGCDPYTYFNVDVSLGASITGQNRFDTYSCGVFVLDATTGRRIQEAALKKLEGPNACQNISDSTTDIGVMDYSTARSSGTLRFFVNMLDTASAPIAEGSANKGVSPGHVLSVDLVIEACGTSCTDTSTFK